MERIMLKKGDVTRTFNKQGNKIIATLEVGGAMVSNPTLDMMYADGWEDYTPEPVPPYEPTREEKINAEIREKYTENDEFMVLRQYNANPDNPAYKEAFDEYNAYVEAILAKYPEENE